MSLGRAAEGALEPLAEGRRRFQQLADAGREGAADMVAVTFSETGDCLMALGRLDKAAEAYEEAIQLSQRLENRRQVAVWKGPTRHRATVQERFGEALEAHVEARDTFRGARRAPLGRSSLASDWDGPPASWPT